MRASFGIVLRYRRFSFMEKVDLVIKKTGLPFSNVITICHLVLFFNRCNMHYQRVELPTEEVAGV